MINCAMRINQIQENPRGEVLSVIPERIPMVVKGDGCNILQEKWWCFAVYCEFELTKLRIDETEGQDAGGH